ncbi:rhomboid family intramembrane serine protease [Flavobacterium muglaense]|uniref:Rhomboid family intramembrane serine protease n=1 Tax=Flavobacterium muglaense TaxID=2764716 RepID=A0A923SEG7_9FLAO|nr:rhomboid family intramembrane serine protease [Flavobacterium muglaense]MBC5836977.1 rhomboid family intramembrane serine protease [Flavobacterium muglaense]MBC5843506.1 rhomboid family intramembrane serine protease [Flavobacterium muglaense]
MEKDFRYSNWVIALPLFSVLLLWFVYWLEIRYDYDFVENGILPRTFSGLQGVIFSPFIHSDMEHLYSNSIPLLILLAALQFFYAKQSLLVVTLGIIFSGLVTWFIGRDSYHIGASGLIYVLVSFIFLKGILTKYYRLVALSLAVIMFYGGMIWYVFPKVDETISWEGHLAGMVTGFMLAIFLKIPDYEKVIKYEWEHPNYDPSQDKFMQRFDENGVFVNLPPVEIEEEMQSYYSSNYVVNYDFIESKKNEPKPES